MFPLTGTYYDPKEKLWSGPIRKDLYSDEITLGEVAWLELCKNPQKVIQIHDTSKEQMTAQEFLDCVTALSKKFLKFGFKPGDVVGLYTHNSTHIATVMVASFLCGTPVNALHPGFDKDNALLIYKVTAPKIIFCDVENYEIAQRVCKDLKSVAPIYIMNGEIEGVPNILDLLKSVNEPFSFPCVNLKGDDIAVILCSSGTTGTPKGVMCSHRALLNQYTYLNLKADSVTCTFSTMYWASGLWNLTSALKNCCLRIVTDKPYTTDYFLGLVERYKITHMIMNSIQIAELSMFENTEKIQTCLNTIDTIMVGGSKIPLFMQQKITEILSVNDKRPGFCLAYGMSELSSILSINGHYFCEHKLGSEGKLVPNKKVRIVDKSGKFLGPNKHGEIIISTPHKWFGYYQNVEATRKAYINNWLYTGDIGFFDEDGFIYVCGRNSDVFKARNFQIYPQLIEEVIIQVPGVFEACVFGIPDLVAQNLTTCAVVRTQDGKGSKLTAKDIASHVETKMGTMYHLTGGVYFLEDIPKTGSGKVQRTKVLKIVEKIKNKL